MANYSINVDLSKMEGAFRYTFTGKDGNPHRCLCIPMEADGANLNGLFVGMKGVYLELSAWQMREPRNKDTHYLKVSYDQSIREKMTDEERKDKPIVGGLREIVPKNQSTQGAAPIQPAVPATALQPQQTTLDAFDDLPF